MATPIIRDTSLFGVEKESTEGTFVAPSASTAYFQPLEDAFELSPQREQLDRTVINSSIGPEAPKVGMKSVSGSVGVEFRASGVEGGDVDYSPFLESAFGAKRSISTTTTTKSSGNTGSVLQIEDADISKFNEGDIVVIKQTGAHHPCVVTAKSTGTGTATITVLPSKPSGNFANSVVISKSTTFYTAASGHPALSVAYYWGNQIRQAAIGAKVTSMSLENFTTGQLANLSFAFEGLSYTEVDGAAPHTPSYDSGTPPVILRACLFADGTEIMVNEFTLSLENTLAFQTSTCNSNGKVGSRVVERAITCSFNPYSDDTTFSWFTKFDENTQFSLFVQAYNPSATAGEITMGSCVGIYLPRLVVTEYGKGDLEGLVIDQVSAMATRGAAGSATPEEMYLGLI